MIIIDPYLNWFNSAKNHIEALGAILWLDASDTSTISTSFDRVSQWRDKSIQLNNFVQGTVNNQPDHTEDSFIKFTSTTFLSNSSKQMFTGVNSGDVFLIGRQPRLTVAGGWGRFKLGTQSPDSNGLFREGFMSSSLVTVPGSSPVPLPTSLISLSNNGSLLTIRVNGGLVGSVATTLSVPLIGDQVLGGASSFEIGEIIMFPYVLRDSDRLIVEGYLTHKRGLQASLPIGHPYRDTPVVMETYIYLESESPFYEN
jgi:hypothetical protein